VTSLLSLAYPQHFLSSSLPSLHRPLLGSPLLPQPLCVSSTITPSLQYALAESILIPLWMSLDAAFLNNHPVAAYVQKKCKNRFIWANKIQKNDLRGLELATKPKASESTINLSLLIHSLSIGGVGSQLRGLITAAVTRVRVADAAHRRQAERISVESRSVAVVRVDPSQRRAARGNNLRDQDSTLVLATNSARSARLPAYTRPNGLRGTVPA
jgi:hypothetical protein